MTRIKTVGAMNSQRGMAMVEFVAILPLLILLLVGLIEFGRFTYFSILVANAARAGVQYGAQNLVTADDAAAMQQATLNDGQNVSGLSAAATHFCQCADGTASSCNAGDCATSHRITYVQVNANGSFDSLFRYPGLPSTFNVSATAVMRVEQ